MSFGTAFIYIPLSKPKRVERVKSMTKTTNNVEPKSSKKYAKTRGEHYKDIVIAILVTSIIAKAKTATT